MLDKIRKIVETKLACIDISNKHNNGGTDTKLRHELAGMRLVLDEMGVDLKININPYYWENSKPSTYEINIETPSGA